MFNKAIFLDRDGVINKEVNYLHEVDNFIFINGIFEACHHFLKLDYKIIIITNQSGISRGYYNENDYQNLTEWMLNQFKNKGISILDNFYCPHLPESNCSCRKPKPGMFIAAKNKYNIDMALSWMIGDKETDSEAAQAAGINNTILLKSGSQVDNSHSHSRFTIDSLEESKFIITS